MNTSPITSNARPRKRLRLAATAAALVASAGLALGSSTAAAGIQVGTSHLQNAEQIRPSGDPAGQSTSVDNFKIQIGTSDLQ